jgi:rubrerythrin
MKNFFKSSKNETHFGNVKIEGFVEFDKTELEKVLRKVKDKIFWRCTVCNDLYVGKIPPKQCPTCFVVDAYVEINEKEFREMIK